MASCVLSRFLLVVMTAFALSMLARPLYAQAMTHHGSGSDPYTDLSTYLLPGDQTVPSSTAGVGSGSSPPSNSEHSMVLQIGHGNTASVDMQGYGNATAQVQFGSANSSTLTVTGDQNALGTSQIGNHNTAAISVTGQGNTIVDSQVGNNLSFQLQQVGNGKTVVIQQVGQR
jgi:hypothetical protein